MTESDVYFLCSIQSTVDSWFVRLVFGLADGQSECTYRSQQEHNVRKGKSQNTVWVIQMVLFQEVSGSAWTVLDADEVKHFQLRDSRGRQSSRVFTAVTLRFQPQPKSNQNLICSQPYSPSLFLLQLLYLTTANTRETLHSEVKFAHAFALSCGCVSCLW